jgi:CcmD family protein
MSGEMKYVWASYALTWIGMGFYALSIIRRARRAEAELKSR